MTRHLSRTTATTLFVVTLAGILGLGHCTSARAAEPLRFSDDWREAKEAIERGGPTRRAPWEIPQTPAQRAESEANRLSTMRPPPKLFTCSAEAGAWSKPDLAEFWIIVRSSPSLAILRDRILGRFEKLPIIFDACVDYADGNGPVRHRTVIRDIFRDPADTAIELPRVIVRVEVVAPVREHQRRDIPVELKAGGL